MKVLKFSKSYFTIKIALKLKVISLNLSSRLAKTISFNFFKNITI
tara:strand:+ start:1248 stop:1382 length:135 start_codon:yes stop_codon:yes gene_type:complete